MLKSIDWIDLRHRNAVGVVKVIHIDALMKRKDFVLKVLYYDQTFKKGVCNSQSRKLFLEKSNTGVVVKHMQRGQRLSVKKTF